MDGENVTKAPTSAEEEPEVFSVVIDGQLTHFNRRSFLGKAAVASAAVTALASGCVPRKSVNVQATVDEAVASTANAAKLTEIAGAPAEVAMEIPTDTPQPTKAPTQTLEPTATRLPDTPTVTATEKPQGIQSAITGDRVNFRSGPGTGYAPITTLLRGDSILLTGRLEDNVWLAVGLSDPSKPGSLVNGWIKFNLVDTAGKDISSLPVITDIPPTPTPLPGKYGNTGAGQKGIDYTYTDTYGNTYPMSMDCGAPIPPGAVCTCNCITVPRTCSCVDHTAPSNCTCDTVHYWYPN